MKLTLEIADTKIETLIRDLFDNFPEAAGSGVCPTCVDYDYKGFRFSFQNDEGKVKTIGLSDAVRGWKIFAREVMAGKLPGLSVAGHDIFDAGAYDAEAILAVAQFALYDDCIYG